MPLECWRSTSMRHDRARQLVRRGTLRLYYHYYQRTMPLVRFKQKASKTFVQRGVNMDPRSRIPTMIGETLRPYRIEAKLGAGGMGVVYRALDSHLDWECDVKVVALVALGERGR